LAKTLIFLQEKRIETYDDLVSKSSEMTAKKNELNEKICAIDNRLKEISELQKHIGTYGKTKEKYQAWRNIKNKKKAEEFYEVPENRADIVLHQAAKKFFNKHKNLRVDGKIPSIKSLREEWATLKSKKSSLYKDLNKIKSEAKELAIARQNAEAVLFGENRERIPQKSVGFER
jgi:chromosome segregation ATPase